MNEHDELRAGLEQRLAQLEQRMSRIRADRRHEAGPLDRDSVEQATELENDEVLDALDDSGRRELEEIRVALARIESRAYGTCAECRAEIPAARLRALPTTTLCVSCAD
jgi:RNA polymerase-binding transcription factor DksA